MLPYPLLRRALRIAAVGLAATPIGLAVTTDQPQAIEPTAVLLPPLMAEDDDGFDCRTMGNYVCGYGADRYHPEAITFLGEPVDDLRTAHALSCTLGAATGAGSDSCLIFTDPAVLNRLIDLGAFVRSVADAS